MAKAVAPAMISIPGVAEAFSTNAVPDTFDDRDLEYRPRLQPLPAVIDQRDADKAFFVLQQQGNSCTGHAVAAAINTVLAHARRSQRSASEAASDSAPPATALNVSLAPSRAPVSATANKAVEALTPFAVASADSVPSALRVSPYMLYRLARRYDEFQGEKDVGSSLRGAFKGWFHHGVATEVGWPRLDLSPEPDLNDPVFVRRCRALPLGAFYRINPYRLDDMQSAITELNAIAVSAAIHEGWITPQIMQRGGDTMYVISRSVNATTRGGHAFALVGYNEVGFLVQNSWGKAWGKNGFATLPYEDWLDSAYDAWVARPGVPQTPFYSGRSRTAQPTGGGIAIGPGLDVNRLAVHAVALGNDGHFADTGRLPSSATQIERVFTHMDRWHDFWINGGAAEKRHVILYAHGGLVSEDAGLLTCQRHLNWWLNNCVYPIYFAWRSDAASTVMDSLFDLTHGKLPFGFIPGFDVVEQIDRLVELVTRSSLRWVWEEMKKNARAASDPLADPGAIHWPPANGEAAAMMEMPGASLVVTRLKEYVALHGADKVCVHLVGHSAGSIFHAALLQRLVQAEVRVDSLQFLAPGLRVDDFMRDVAPHLTAGGRVERFANFDLNNTRELADTCPAGGTDVYHKSLLYLVSRAFDELIRNGIEAYEVPLIGMEHFFDQPVDGASSKTLRQVLDDLKATYIFAPSAAPEDCRSTAAHHGGIHEDPPTMTSVLMRILDVGTHQPAYDYQTNSALKDADRAPSVDDTQQPAGASGSTPMPVAAGVQPPGTSPLVDMAEAQKQQPSAPATTGAGIEVGVAPRSGSAIIDMLQSEGWKSGMSSATGLPQKTTAALAERSAPEAAAVPDESAPSVAAPPLAAAVPAVRPDPELQTPAKPEVEKSKRKPPKPTAKPGPRSKKKR